MTESRSARKHRAIMDAATAVFLRKGYLGTSMDKIAALAAVSKQTVYKHFEDKERLFNEIVGDVMQPTDEGAREAGAALGTADDVEKALYELARSLLTMLRDRRVLRLRRLIVGEAERFPALGRAYWERAFRRGLDAVADGLRELSRRGLIETVDPDEAAGHFAGLVLWIPMNRAMFCGEEETPSDAEINRHAGNGVRAFLAAYGA